MSNSKHNMTLRNKTITSYFSNNNKKSIPDVVDLSNNKKKLKEIKPNNKKNLSNIVQKRKNEEHQRDEFVEIYENSKTGFKGKQQIIKQILDEQKHKENKNKLHRNDMKKIIHELDSYTVNARSIDTYPRMKIITSGLNVQWQADLVDMQRYSDENDGYNYLLTSIDLGSRFAQVVPLKSKNSSDVIKGFVSLIKKRGKPKLLQTDKGKEFENKQFQDFLKAHHIKHFTPPTNWKAAMVERFHLTLKGRMAKLWTHKGTYRYIDDLQNLVDNYNNTVHSVVKMKPVDVNEKNIQTAVDNSNNYNTHANLHPPKFQVGDLVRIKRKKHTFVRHTDDKYTFEVFKIKKVIYSLPYTYYVEELKKGNNNIDDTENIRYYEPELIKFTGDIHKRVWKIDKIIDERGKDDEKEVLVKWLGLPEQYNEWILKSTIG